YVDNEGYRDYLSGLNLPYDLRVGSHHHRGISGEELDFSGLCGGGEVHGLHREVIIGFQRDGALVPNGHRELFGRPGYQFRGRTEGDKKIGPTREVPIPCQTGGYR